MNREPTLPTPPRPWALIPIAAALLACGLPAHAATAMGDWPIPRAATNGPLHAGDLVELRWAPQTGRVEELELMLSLDGGRSWHVRVSPELPGSSTGYTWRVPNLPSADARLRIRMRTDGHEMAGEIGGRFTIISDPGRPLTLSLVSEGAWWSGCEPAARVVDDLAAGATPEISSTHARSASEEGPRLVARPPVAGPRVAHDPSAGISAPLAARWRNAPPQGFPLRN